MSYKKRKMLVRKIDKINREFSRSFKKLPEITRNPMSILSKQKKVLKLQVKLLKEFQKTCDELLTIVVSEVSDTSNNTKIMRDTIKEFGRGSF